MRRGWLGIAGQNRPVPRDVTRRLGVAHGAGVEVTGFDERGPAARSGLRAGDVVVGIDDKPVASVDDIHRALARLKWPVAAALTLRVIRDQRLVEVPVTPRSPVDGRALRKRPLSRARCQRKARRYASAA